MPLRIIITAGDAMNIGEAAQLSGVSAKMIRYYETIGLISKATRSYSGYRDYQERDIHILRFIRRARAAGFSTLQIKKLLALWQDRQRPAREVKQFASEHLSELKEKIAELEAIATALSQLIAHCHGDDRPDCPILDTLAGESTGGKFDECGKRHPPIRRHSAPKPKI